jgi:fibronectin type III domain protein
MVHARRQKLFLGAAVTLAVAGILPHAARAATAPFEEARMIIEYNSTDQDIGIQFFLDSDGWRSIDIFAPRGQKIFSASAQGSLLAQGGGTELFLESVEPTLDELSFDEFFDRFPEGEYLFVGKVPGGGRLAATAEFDHDIPKGPQIVKPGPGGRQTCAQGVPIPAVISWHPVTETIEGEPVEIAGYEVIVENDEVFDIHLPGDATQVTVPAEFLEPGTDYIFEVLAIAEGGNQTITEGCFRTGG